MAFDDTYIKALATYLRSQNASDPPAIGAIGLINLRHALYSASVAPYLRTLPPRWAALCTKASPGG